MKNLAVIVLLAVLACGCSDFARDQTEPLDTQISDTVNRGVITGCRFGHIAARAGWTEEEAVAYIKAAFGMEAEDAE